MKELRMMRKGMLIMNNIRIFLKYEQNFATNQLILGIEILFQGFVIKVQVSNNK